MEFCLQNATLEEQLDYYWFESDNGTRLYCPNAQCNGNIRADPDVAGIGVLAANIFFAAATTIATIVFMISTTDYKSDFRDWVAGRERHGSRMLKKYTRTSYFCLTILKPLCDLQLITGVAVIVAALTQLHQISSYHFDLLIAYWFLTFNSIWAMETITARRDEASTSEDSESAWRIPLQRALAVISCILSAVAQVYSIRRCSAWNELDGQRCYRYLEMGSDGCDSEWFWLIGQCLFVVYQLIRLVPGGQDALDFLEDRLVNLERRSISTIRALLRRIGNRPYQTLGSPGSSGHKPSGRTTLSNTAINAFLMFLSSCALLFFWSLRQFTGLWAVGDGTPALGVWVYLVYFFLNAIEPIAMKILNKPLVDNSELTLGVGQLLALMLILSLLISVFEAKHNSEMFIKRQEEKEKEKEQEYRTDGVVTDTDGRKPNKFARPFFMSRTEAFHPLDS